MTPESHQSPDGPKFKISTLWIEHGGKGKCPPLESQVMKRLVSSCEEYIKIFLLQRELSRQPRNLGGDSENYFARKPDEVVVQAASESDIRRRKLHNDIAEILMGKSRSSMSEGEANNVADFACRVATGLSIFEI